MGITQLVHIRSYWLALLSAAILCGWPLVAGFIASCWGRICRAGEVLLAVREDLVIPSDLGDVKGSVFLKVKEPKTRYKAARHQMARMDYPDPVELVSLAFGSLGMKDRLWPRPAQLMRSRFRQLLSALGLTDLPNHAERQLDLGSLRAGGATRLLMATESADLVQRRGRWLAVRTMNVYLQEVGATVYFPQLPSLQKDKFLELASSFPALLSRMHLLVSSWFRIFQTG